MLLADLSQYLQVVTRVAADDGHEAKRGVDLVLETGSASQSHGRGHGRGLVHATENDGV